MTSSPVVLRPGALNAAISQAVVKLLNEHAGRGPTKARTIHSGKFVLCVLEDTMTKAERSIAAGGHEESVLKWRHVLQHTMEKELIAAVEALTHRRVAAFLSDNHIEPDLSAELFILEDPVPEAVEVTTAAEGVEVTTSANGAGDHGPAPSP